MMEICFRVNKMIEAWRHFFWICESKENEKDNFNIITTFAWEVLLEWKTDTNW